MPALGAVLLTQFAACVPFVVPPGQIAISGGGRTDKPRQLEYPEQAQAITDSRPDDSSLSVDLRASVQPLQLFRSLNTRSFDGGLGYVAEGPRLDALRLHGPYLQLDYYPYHRALGGGAQRFGIRGTTELLYGLNTDEQGFGVSLGVVYEVGGFAQGLFGSAGAGIAGAALGEGAFGIYAGTSLRQTSAQAYYWVPSVGLYARLPAMAGLICCLVPHG
jgi:hypothetical protein